MLLLLGNCVDVMGTLDAESVDSIVTDPPYGLEFMGKEWDKLGWQSGGGFSKPGIGDRKTGWVSYSSTSRFGAANPTCATCGGRLRGKKKCCCETPEWKPIGKRRNPENEGLPDDMTGGGYARQLSAMQEWHYAWAVEALRVAKPGAHLLAFGGTRTFHRLACAIEDAGWEIRDCIMWVYGSGFPKSHNLNGDWQGWGTALKPAWEPIIVARKPLIGTVAKNVQQHGTGAINVDACRVPTDPSVDDPRLGGNGTWGTENAAKNVYEGGYAGERVSSSPLGRWPANLIHDGSNQVAKLFPHTQSGVMKAGTKRAAQDGPGSVCYGTYGGCATSFDTYADSGSAARFFYCAKASKSDRGEGNNHPTVKPQALMRYLCRLVAPPGGTILDPFMGSGSTLVAAKQEGFNAIGIELNQEYLDIAQKRIASVNTEPTLF